MDHFCKEYASTYPDFKEKIYIRVIIKPADGSDAPPEYRRIFRLSHYNKKVPSMKPILRMNDVII